MFDFRAVAMDLRGCRCAAPLSQNLLGGLSPLGDPQSARGFPTSVRSGRQKKWERLAVRACNSGDERELGAGGPNMVDADMILLRKRIFELKRQENNYESPQDWMEWEKKWQGEYHSGVFRAMEWLQFNLINTRPAFGMALVGLASLTVPASVAVALIACATYVESLIGNGHV